MKFEQKVVDEVFDSILSNGLSNELYHTSYLESYLLLTLEDDYKYVISCICMINEHFKRQNSAKNILITNSTLLEHILQYMTKVIPNLDESDIRIEDWVYGEMCLFLYHLFLSIDCEAIRDQILPLVSPSLILHLSPNSREDMFDENDGLRDTLEEEVESGGIGSSLLIPWILSRFVKMICQNLTSSSAPHFSSISSSLQLTTLLLSQIPTRRFCVGLVRGSKLVPFLRLLLDDLRSSSSSKLNQDEDEEEEEEERKEQSTPQQQQQPTINPNLVKTLSLQVDLLDVFIHFPIEDLSGEMEDGGKEVESTIKALYSIQKEAFQLAENPSRYSSLTSSDDYREVRELVGMGDESSLQPGDEEGLREISFMSSQKLGSSLLSQLTTLSTDILQYFVISMDLLEDFSSLMMSSTDGEEEKGDEPDDDTMREVVKSREFLTKLLINHLAPPQSSFDPTSHENSYLSTSLYPTEESLFYSPQHISTLPTLSLQYLSISDLIQRNFSSFNHSTKQSLAEHMINHVSALHAHTDHRGGVVWDTTFSSSSTHAVPASEGITIEKIHPPLPGSTTPSRVDAKVEIDLFNFSDERIRKEWDDLMRHDDLLLIAVQPPDNMMQEEQEGDQTLSHQERERKARAYELGIEHVRGCEIIEILDEAGESILQQSIEAGEGDDKNDLKKGGKKQRRGKFLRRRGHGTKRTFFIRLDPIQYQQDVESGTEAWQVMNVVLRREGFKNNWRWMMKSVLNVIESSSSKEAILPLWYRDLLLGYGPPPSTPLKDSTTSTWNDTSGGIFNNLDHVKSLFPDHLIEDQRGDVGSKQPLQLTFVERNIQEEEPPKKKKTKKRKRRNSSAGSESEVKATQKVIQLNESPNSFPLPKSEVVWNENQLNVFHHALQTPSFTCLPSTKFSNNNLVLSQLISSIYSTYPDQKTILVGRSNQSIDSLLVSVLERGVEESHVVRLGGFSKLTAEDSIFGFDFSGYGRLELCLANRMNLLSNIQELGNALSSFAGLSIGDVGYSCETCHSFFKQHIEFRIKRWDDEDQTLFRSVPIFLSYDLPLKKAVEHVFNEIEGLRWTEFLRNDQQRVDQFVSHHARVIAMTSTHAARARERMIRMGFCYQNVIMVEVDRMSEVEAFIPMNIQSSPSSNIQRVVISGRRGDQSLIPDSFGERICRLYGKIPSDLANYEEMVSLKRHRRGKTHYKIIKPYLSYLKNENPTKENISFFIPPSLHISCLINQPAQFVEVGDYQEKGEEDGVHEGEAEYLVAVYMYLRLKQVPKESIAIFCGTDNQKQRIEEIIVSRCGHEMFGFTPHVFAMSTIPIDEEVLIEFPVILCSTVSSLNEHCQTILERLESSASQAMVVFGRSNEFDENMSLWPLVTSSDGIFEVEEGGMEDGVDQMGQLVHSIATKQHKHILKRMGAELVEQEEKESSQNQYDEEMKDNGSSST